MQCDQAIDRTLTLLWAEVTPPLPASGHTTRGANALAFDAPPALYALLGVDLTRIHGLGPCIALKLIGECGTDVSPWPTCKHITSWLTLAPSRQQSLERQGPECENAAVR